MGRKCSDNRTNTQQPKSEIVAKLATDLFAAPRHNQMDMPPKPDKIEFNRIVKAAGFRGAASAWLAATGGERSQISKVLKGERTIKRRELYQLSIVLKTRVRILEKVLGDDAVLGLTSAIIILGTISEGGDIVLVAPDKQPSLDAFYSEAVHSYNGNLLKVEDDTVANRFQRNDLVGYGEPEAPSDRLDGLEVIVRFKDGRTRLRKMHKTDLVGFYTFTPIGIGTNQAPETSDQIQWVARVEAIFMPEP